ncbi:MAG: histidinol dehydrogenase [Halobacteria archaeon]
MIATDPRELRFLLNRRSSIESLLPRVRAILRDVRVMGDRALRRYTKRFDGCDLGEFRVPPEEVRAAGRRAPEALRRAARNIRRFHERQRRRGWSVRVEPGVVAGVRYVPLRRVGLYVPRGYGSTALMTSIPAKVAGVPGIALCTPPDKRGRVSPLVLQAAALSGVEEVIAAGGAQAVGALAHGTESIRPVEKIAGPGNAWVTAAKIAVRGLVEIDFPAGPSEAVILADATAPVEFVVADLRAQLEHGAGATGVLVTDSERLARAVERRMGRRVPILRADLPTGLDFINDLAPEHVEVIARDAERVARRVRTAGALFIGPWSPIAAGDFATGTNHVLPTAGFARVFSGLGVEDFQRRMAWQRLSREGVRNLAPAVAGIARAEGMAEHARSVAVRSRARR